MCLHLVIFSSDCDLRWNNGVVQEDDPKYAINDSECFDQAFALHRLERYEETITCYGVGIKIVPNSEGIKLRKYKTKIERGGREGYEMDGLEEMMK